MQYYLAEFFLLSYFIFKGLLKIIVSCSCELQICILIFYELQLYLIVLSIVRSIPLLNFNKQIKKFNLFSDNFFFQQFTNFLYIGTFFHVSYCVNI